MGTGSGPGTSLSQTEPEGDLESKPALYLLSREEQWKMPLRQVPWNSQGGCWDLLEEGYRPERGQKESKATSKAKVATWSVTRLGTAFRP